MYDVTSVPSLMYGYFSLSVADEHGSVHLEVGVSGTLRYTYHEVLGDKIHAMRVNVFDPTKNTIVEISLQKWYRWVEIEKGIRDQIQDLMRGNYIDCKFHLGGMMYISMNSEFRCVQFRQHFLREQNGEQKVLPSVSMSFMEFYYFLKHMKEFIAKIPAMKQFKPCYSLKSHPASCLECYPLSSGMELEED